MKMRPATIVPLLALLGPALRPLPAGTLDPTLEEAARHVVAIRVDREEEPLAIPRLPVAGAQVPQEVVDYYRRPPGPATGLLLDGEGNILTTFYNVAGTLKSIEVLLPDGQVRPARLVATAKADDLALVRTESPLGLEVPPVRWADAGRLRVGRMAAVLGRSPDPASPTVTFGIVSAVGRNGGRAFQTDAKLNPGNVGGPVTDLQGSILGIACFVGHTYPLWGLNSGIGFATKAETIAGLLPRLLAGETVPPPEFPFLGVGMSPRPPEGNIGARLGEVQPGTPAADAGLRTDDIVVEFDGEKIQDFVDLRRSINRRRPGDEVVLRVKRGAEEIEVKARLGKRK